MPQQKADGSAKKPKSATNKLNLRQQAFVGKYADPSSPTFAKAPAAYSAVYDTTNKQAASACASRLLARENVKEAVTEICERSNIALGARIALLSDTAHGRTTRRVVERALREDGESGQKEMVTVREIITEPTFTERNQAINMIAKLTGDYERPKMERELWTENFKALMDKVHKDATANEGG